MFKKSGFLILSWVTVNKQYRNDDPWAGVSMQFANTRTCMKYWTLAFNHWHNNAQHWYLQCTYEKEHLFREKKDSSWEKQDTSWEKWDWSPEKPNASWEKQDVPCEIVETYIWVVLYVSIMYYYNWCIITVFPFSVNRVETSSI